MKTNQNILAVVISIGALIICYMFLWRISELESIVDVLSKSESVVDISSLQNYLDRNVEVFSILTTTLFAVLSIVLGFIGFQWLTTTVNDHKVAVVEMISFMNKRNDEISELNEKRINDVITKQSAIYNKNNDNFLNALFELYTNQAILYLKNAMPELHLESNIKAAGVLQEHPQRENLNSFLLQIIASITRMVSLNIHIHPISKTTMSNILTKMLTKTTDEEEIRSLSLLVSTIEGLPVIVV